jgi:hypothetical protein
MAADSIQALMNEILKLTGKQGDEETGGQRASSLVEFFRWMGDAVNAKGSKAGTGSGPAPLMTALALMPAAASSSSTSVRGTVQVTPLTPAEILQKRTQTVTQSSTAQASGGTQTSGGGIANPIGRTTLKLFTSGLGLIPLVSGLVGLFGKGGSKQPEPLVKFTLPPSLRIEAANSRGAGLQYVDYGQSGTPRVWSSPPSNLSNAETELQGDWGTRRRGDQATEGAAVLNSQFFMDHSSDIARAVREAMLNMHPLNDVVSDL